MSSPQDGPHHDAGTAARQLTSWKEIAAYLKRDVRTVQRWERNECLPVHRQMHQARASVFVTTGELDAWVLQRTGSEEASQPEAPRLWTNWRMWAGAGFVVVALAVLVVWKHTRRDDAVTIRQLLLRPDVDSVGGPSWDGRFVPYRNNNAELLLYDTETRQSSVVLHGPENVRTNFLNFIAAPDGSQVAYMLESQDGGGELRLLMTDGSGERTLLADPKYIYYNPRSWSPDGRTLAAVLWEKDGPRDVVLIDVATGASRVLYGSAAPPTNAQISPDGRYVAYNEHGDVYAVPTEGGTPLAAATGPARDFLIGWAPDGRLVFQSDRSGTNDIWAIKVGEAGREPQLLWKDLSMQPLGLTKRGDIFFSRSTLKNDLITAELISGHLAADPTPLPATRYQGKNRAPDYSPDGQSLAYVAPAESAKGFALRIRTLANNEEREIPLPMPRVDQIRWYPDGKAILVQGGWEKMPRRGFYKVLLWVESGKTSSQVTPVLEGYEKLHQSVNPTFSLDGRSLYFNQLETPTHSAVVRLDLATGLQTKVVEPKDALLRLYSLSPDQKQIVYDVDVPPTTRNRLYVRALSGGEPRLLTEAEAALGNGGLLWANSETILFHSPDPRAIAVNQLTRIPVDGSPSSALAKTGVIMRMSLHPDRRHLMWQSQTYSVEMSVIQNLLSGAPIE
jgi:Tol biopolymer transport system component